MTPPTVAVPAPAPAPAAVNRAPTITTESAAVVAVGVTYDYLPAASDPDGDALRFTANNLPPWASLDPNTGRITGTPGESDLGEYESITIVVADAAARTESGAFTITVVTGAVATGGTGVASLQWETPPSKVDGTPLDDLAGYRILYGRTADELDRSVLIPNPSTTSYEFATLDPGTWFFAVVAVNAGGLEGPATTLAQKSI
ncbi:MAG: fibronectin type III domain-containing protein [Steroidobacteraceae bacterium]|nr:fibronectin type III domain-containing protein [Steroidobacteraceae bacterium]